MEENKKKGIGLLVIGIIILVVAIIAMIVYGIVQEKTDDGNTAQNVIDTSTGKKVDPELLELYNMEEYDRIKHYFNEYITHIEKGEYDTAYAMLNQDFKNTYYKTLEQYKTYVQNKYPPILTVKYDGVTRLGEYYVLNINFIDIFNSTEKEEKYITQKFIIYEKDYNDYVMSFQAE